MGVKVVGAVRGSGRALDVGAEIWVDVSAEEGEWDGAGRNGLRSWQMTCHMQYSLCIRLLFPKWIQSFWVPEEERGKDEDLERTILRAASPYTRTKPAVYELEDTKPVA